MKIMHIISGGDKGGAKTHMFALLDELCKIADVTVVCLMQGVFYQEIQERSVRTVLLEQKNRMDLSVCRTVEHMVQEEGFDIINAHGARANFVAMLLRKRKLRIPIVTTIHSDYLLDFDTLGKKLIFTPLNMIALKKLRYKIAVSDSFRDMLISRGFHPNDIRTVYNGMRFDEPINPVSKEAFAARFSIPYDPDKVYIGIAARFNRVKGVDVFLQAAAQVLQHTDKARFVIIGEGEDEGSLKALAQSLGIGDKVYFLGFVRENYDFYHFIDINTLTSLSESFPYSLLEGARMKKPTVASAVGGVPQLILDGETGLLFDNQDAAECSRHLLWMIEHQDQARHMGQALYDYASQHFSSHALAAAYLQNYEAFIQKYHRKKAYDAVLSGYYGFGNFGDDLVLRTLITEIQRRNPQLELLVLSRKPRESAQKFGVDCKNRFSLFAVHHAIRQSGAYINGGGSLLTDVTSRRSLYYYANLLIYAKRHGLTTALLSNGVGPLRYSSSRRKIQQALAYTDLITLRDRDSLELVQKLGYENAYLSSDLAVLSSPKSNRGINRQFAAYGVTQGKYAVVCLRDWRENAPDFESVLARGCDFITEKYGLLVVLLPVQPERDLGISQEVARQMKSRSIILAKQAEDIDMVYNWIAEAGLCVSMRLHPLICAFAAGTPLLGISYDKKIAEFLDDIQGIPPLRAEDIHQDQLCSALDAAMSSSVSSNKSILHQMQTLAKKSVDLLMMQLQKGRDPAQ